MSAEQRALQAVQRWAPRYAAGRYRPWALLKPPLREGERWGTKLTGIGVSQVSATDPLSGIDAAQPAAGLAYATSERLLVAEGREVRREWEWAQLDQVVVLPYYAGVLLRTSGPTHDCVHRVRVRHDPYAPPPWKTAARWLAVEGCFAASRGRLDAWLEQLPARVLTS